MFIREYTRDMYGRETEWNTRCIEVRQEGDEVLATLEHDGGDQERVRCRYLVACDGINSRVRSTLALEQQQSDYKGTVLQNLDAFLHGFPDADDWVHYCAGTDHFIMVVKLPGGFYRLLLSDRGEAADPNVPTRVAFMNLIDRHFDGVSLGDTVWHSKWESWVRLAHTYRCGNVFLAGDSAHVHSTTGGWLEAVVGRCSGISYTYHDSIGEPQGLAPLPGPASGDRAPDADLAAGGTLFDLTCHTGYTLVAMTREGARAEAEATLAPLASRFGRVVRTHAVEYTPSLEAAYSTDDDTHLYLIRPDGYIGFRCRAHEADRLTHHLGHVLTL